VTTLKKAAFENVIISGISDGGGGGSWGEYIGTGPPSTANSHWTGALDMAWTGSAWDNIGFPQIQEVGTWVNGFRPTHIRVTYTATGDFTLDLYDQDPAIIASQASYVSGTSVPITFTGDDIRLIYFNGANADLLVTSIEFFS